MAREPKKNVTKPAATSSAAAPAKKLAPAAKKAPAPKAAKPAGTSPKKPAAKPAAPRKAAATTKAPARASTRKAASKSAVSPEQRYRMIQDAAYYIAEKHGFTGDNHAFWLQAEQEIDSELAAK